MKKSAKALLLSLCAVLLVAASVMGTLAYLTSTDEVKNTFTVGKVQITLDEAKVNEYGKEVDESGTPIKEGETAPRVQSNEYKLIPGHTYVKDPTIHVAEGSEDCWLIVQVNDPLAEIEADSTIAAQMVQNGWSPIEDTTDTYGYKEEVSGGKDVVIFSYFKILGDYSDLSDYEDKEITVKAYAVQADGFDSPTAAMAALNTTPPAEPFK